MFAVTLRIMVEPRLLQEHRIRIEEFTARLVDPYLERLRGRPLSARTKEFNDPVWGTLQIRAEEVIILDSPLLQRLRRIRQLGVVHYVYPAATHSRLEHSLGVVHQVQRLVTSINEHGLAAEGRAKDERPIGDELERTLRIAALCHDIGHGALSHVSEYALDSDRQCKNLRIAFQNEMKTADDKQLSEIAAYYMLGSEAFARLAVHAADASGLSKIADLSSKLQNLVIGHRIDGELILIHELISGPFDADKLDYLTRDATMCGVPVVTDVPRLIQKVRATRADREALTPRLKKVPASSSGYVITGISRSGGRTLDELALARILMFDKVYRHQKVRSAEAIAFSLVTILCRIVDVHPAELILRFADDELLSLTRERISELAAKSYEDMSSAERAAVDVAVDLSARLRERRLFVRGFAFASVMTEDAYRLDPEHSAGLKTFLMACKQPDGRDRFVAVVGRYVREIAGHLEMSESLNLPGGAIEPYLCVSPPKPVPKTASEDTGHAHLIDDDGHLTQVQEDAGETTAWTDAYVATRDLGHIFCPPELAPMVFIAAEAALRQIYSVHLPASMLMYAKQSATEIEEHKTTLARAGWYDDKPLDLRPRPTVLRQADAKDRIGKIVDALAGYAGPTMSHLAGSADVPPTTVRSDQVLAFLQQFPNEELVEAALRVLEGLRVLGRREAVATLNQFVTKHPEFKGGNCCTLGESKDSSAVITYFLGDAVGGHGMQLKSLTDALNDGAKPIVFVDDFLGTGNQVTDIFQAYLGEARTNDMGETRTTLVPQMRELLRKARIGLAFIAATDAGLENARTELGDTLSLNVTVFASMTDNQLPFLDTIGLDPELRERFKNYVSEAVRPLLANYAGKEREPKWVDDRLLGYGNRGLLLSSTYNTPSATLTALWIHDEDAGSPPRWQPLLPRRRKF